MRTLKSSESDKIVAFIVALLLFFRTQPYFLWGVEDFSRITCSILIPIFCFQYLSFSKKNWIVFILFFLSFLLVGLLRGSDIFRIINLLFLAFIPILRVHFTLKVYKYFKLIFSFLLVFSIVMYLIVVLTNWKSTQILEPLNGLKDYKYYKYPFLVLPNNFNIIIANMRFHGMFDEPGVVGTFAGIFLAIDKFNLKSWQNKVIFIAGLLSLSLYFFVLLIFVPIYSLNGRYRLIAIFLITVFYISTITNRVLYDLIWFRLSWNPESNSISGFNRGEGEIKQILSANLFSKNFFFGYGYNEAEKFMGGASIYLTIFREGFLFVLLNLTGYIVSAFHKLTSNKGDLLLFVIILLATFYQRPALFDVVYIFLFTVMLYKFEKDFKFSSNI